MDRAARVMDLFGKKDNIVNILLIGAFTALSVRSMSQQRDIQALQAEKETLEEGNKAMRKTMWDWKQKLFNEATDSSSPVPIARLKTIYGDIPSTPPQQGITVSADARSATPKLVI